jgi:23S rRNA (adenine2503-C2)-methyltransferase
VLHAIPIFSLTPDEYAAAVLCLLGKGENHARRIYSEWFKKGAVSALDAWVEPQARELVETILRNTSFFSASISSLKEEGGVKKFLLKFADGLESESVVLPMKTSYTLCISSQVGCRMGCAFCQTGRMGLIRSLSVEEIVFQVFAARFLLGSPIRNLVFMGMGEPFDNYEAVMKAVEILSSDGGFAIPLRGITISTSGRVEEMLRFSKEADPRLHLAVSLNAPNDAIRSKIMPVNKNWDLEALRKAMDVYCEHPKREILVEYVLIKGLNDSLEAADQVAAYLQGLRVRVNLIPYNSQTTGRFAPPDEEVLKAFQNRLKSHGYPALLRITRGRSIMAACGQLGKKTSPILIYEKEGNCV